MRIVAILLIFLYSLTGISIAQSNKIEPVDKPCYKTMVKTDLTFRYYYRRDFNNAMKDYLWMRNRLYLNSLLSKNSSFNSMIEQKLIYQADKKTDTIRLREACVEMRGCCNLPLTLTAGRQMLSFGGPPLYEFLIGSERNKNSFDAL